MGYTDLDWRCINTIRVLAVRLGPTIFCIQLYGVLEGVLPDKLD